MIRLLQQRSSQEELFAQLLSFITFSSIPAAKKTKYDNTGRERRIRPASHTAFGLENVEHLLDGLPLALDEA